jgi:hypothetical protein
LKSDACILYLKSCMYKNIHHDSSFKHLCLSTNGYLLEYLPM